LKESTINTLLAAKSIYNEAKPLVYSGNKHSCSAGLILLQDSIELVVLALLVEKGVDEEKNLESKSFDELLGELKKTGVTIPKSGTIKALNKQRVIIKHYGQLAEPASVSNYAEAADVLIESILAEVLGKSLQDILLSDLIPECETKTYLQAAIKLREEGKFLEGLIEIRKAFYVEYEREYAIHKWADVDKNDNSLGLLMFVRGGLKAPYWTRNKQWIEEHVKTPDDYIQIDHEKIRFDALEWGVSTSEVENLRRLTPTVIRFEKNGEWKISYDLEFPPNAANEQNLGYCLDLAINVVLKKKEHEQLRKWICKENSFEPPTIYIDHPVYAKARTDSDVVHVVQRGFLYTIHKKVSGFDDGEVFYYVSGYEEDENEKYGKNHFWGYLQEVEDNELTSGSG
jgi:hypothetical protein